MNFFELFRVDPYGSAGSLLVQASSGTPGFTVPNVWISQNDNLFSNSS
jgi:hypothetical protein